MGAPRRGVRAALAPLAARFGDWVTLNEPFNYVSMTGVGSSPEAGMLG